MTAPPGAMVTPSPLRTLAIRLRTRTAPAKALALFLLPLPLVLAVVRALIGDDVGGVGLAAGAVACFWAGAVLVWRALVVESRYLLGEQFDLPRIPWKAATAALTAAGSALAASAGGHSLGGTAAFAAFAGIGHLCFYGLDVRPVRFEVTPADGVDVTGVADQLTEASQRLRRIDAAASNIRIPEFRERLARITAVGRDILAQMARDPRDVSRGRRFLHVYLDSAERVTQEYARTPRELPGQPLDDNFRRLLLDMETAFAEQRRRLVEHDTLALDVDIEVLSARLRREGIRDEMEKRS